MSGYNHGYLLKSDTKDQVYSYLVKINGQLSNVSENKDVDYNECFKQLTDVYQIFKTEDNGKSKPRQKGTEGNEALKNLNSKFSLNLIKLLSKNITLTLKHLPGKIYDFANSLLNHLTLNDDDKLSLITKISVILLIDLFETFPNSLNSLTNFSVSQIYKMVKKHPGASSDLVYLLSSITKNASKSDLDDKFQAKIVKLAQKSIMSLPIQFDIISNVTSGDDDSSSTIALKRNWMLVLKQLLILSTASNYEGILASSTSSSSGSKLKPETLMSYQHQFQQSILINNEKVIRYGLGNFCKEVRIATVELLAQLLLSFIPTSKFNPVEYLIDLYDTPSLNLWSRDLNATVTSDNETATEVRKDKNHIHIHDSENIIKSNTERTLQQTGVIETLILYIQLEQFQNSDYLSSNLVDILDLILLKFSALNGATNHIQDQYWNTTLKHFEQVFQFLIEESGSNCHETLLSYTYSKVNLDSTQNYTNAEGLQVQQSTNDKRKREGVLSTLKTSKKNLRQKRKGEVQRDILPYVNPYQCFLILNLIKEILPFGLNFDTVALNQLDESQIATTDVTENSEEKGDSIQEFDGSHNISKKNSFLQETLLNLLVNSYDNIRTYALNTVLTFGKQNIVEMNQLILSLYNLVNHEFRNYETQNKSNPVINTHKNLSGSSYVRLMSYSLALASLIKQTDTTMLQNSTIVKVLSFCTQNLKHNHSNIAKNSSCWIILSSLITLYNDSEFVKLNSAQILVFWKSLLTSQFIGPSSTLNEQDRIDIVDNLKMRNFSLLCLLNYLNSAKLTPELLKQLQFLLTKSYNYLSYLESNIEGVGIVTNFAGNQFNEYDFNPILVNNIHFKNYASNGELSFEKVMISLVLYSKYVLLQCFSKLSSFLKSDINSNLVIFLVKLLGDPKTLSRCTSEQLKEKPNSGKNKSGQYRFQDYDSSKILLNEPYNYSFGVTSKFNGYSSNIDELLIKFPLNQMELPKEEVGILYKEIFDGEELEFQPRQNMFLEKVLEVKFPSWFDKLENLCFQAVDHNLIYDPCIHLFQNYSISQEHATNIVTSLVDISIELFQLAFPHLSSKIQFSLLEQMSNFITAKSVDPLRQKAVCVNISVTIHGMLLNIIKRNSKLEDEFVTVILDILDKLKSNNKDLTEINGDSVSLVCECIKGDKELVFNQVDKFVKKIVNDTNPYERGRNILTLGKIYKRTKVGFSDLSNVILQLSKDPNPIVYYYTLRAAILILEDNLDQILMVPNLLNSLQSNFLNDEFGFEVANNVLVNLRCKYGTSGLSVKLLKTCVTILGPSIRDMPNRDKEVIKNLIVSAKFCIGCTSIEESTDMYCSLLSLLEELVIYDPKLLEGELKFFKGILDFTISKNIKLGVATVSPTSLNEDVLFPFNTSFRLYKLAYRLYVELIKVCGKEVLTKDTVRLMWMSMNVKPCEELKELITLWMESSIDIHWFLTLTSLFKYSAKKLMSPFLETNYQQKLLPLQQRQKKSGLNEVKFEDEEIENIVADTGEPTDSNEPISWEFKLFIYDLMNYFLSSARKNPELLEGLKNKIQDVVNLSFLGSTSPIAVIRLLGIRLLHNCLELFGDIPDPLYPSVSILEQQQAQIISALMPCFNSDNDCESIVEAINVSSKFINLPKIKFYSKKRILNTLTSLLEELSSNKFLKFEYLEDMSEFGKKHIQLSILNCWALFKINFLEDSDSCDVELANAIEKYSTLLNSLWVLVLREYAFAKYNDTSPRELKIYENYWLSFVNVLSLDLGKPSFVGDYLLGDSENFMFILFSQCFESLMKNKDVPEMSSSLNRLVHVPELVNLIFHDEFFVEVVDLLDRLMLIDDRVEVKSNIIDFVYNLFKGHTDYKPLQERDIPKLLELFRLTLLPIFISLPFSRSDFDPEDVTTKLTLSKAASGSNLIIVKKCFLIATVMIPMLPPTSQCDLYACVLLIIAKIYEFNNELLISSVLPHLKQVITECKKVQGQSNLVGIFNKVIRQFYTIDLEENSVVTTTILVTAGDLQLDQDDALKFRDTLLSVIQNQDRASIGIQCIKSLFLHSSRSQNNTFFIRSIVELLVSVMLKDPLAPKFKIAFELLLLLAKSEPADEARLKHIYSILINIAVKAGSVGGGAGATADQNVLTQYLHEKLLFLARKSPSAFKFVLTNLTQDQKSLAEKLTKLESASSPSTTANSSSNPEIQLKVFS